MSSDLPEPLVPPDVDIDGLDSFMLNVDRMLASELLAVSTGDQFKAAFLLWCRAWKQRPAGSLPDDDAVLAGFSGAGGKWKKVRGVALKGFVKCSDGRLYHTTLCEDVLRAAKVKRTNTGKTKAATEARQQKRGGARDDERDVNRGSQRDDKRSGHRVEERDVDDTRSHRQDIDSTGNEERVPFAKANGRAAVAELPLQSDAKPPEKPDKPEKIDPWKAVYDRGKEVFGSGAGGIITNLKKCFDGKPIKVLAKIEDAAEKRDPVSWINAYLWDHGPAGLEGIGHASPAT